MTMTASARLIGGTLRHEINVNERHTIATDEPERLGGTDTAPTPHELLPAMLASCISTMIALSAQNHDWYLQDVRVDADYEPDSTPRRVRVAIHLPKGLSANQIRRLRRVADTCPVKRALEAGFAIDESIELDLATPSLELPPTA